MNELFWQTIARYNATTWPVQLAILAAGILLTVLLYRRPSRATKLAIWSSSTGGLPWPTIWWPAASGPTAA